MGFFTRAFAVARATVDHEGFHRELYDESLAAGADAGEARVFASRCISEIEQGVEPAVARARRNRLTAERAAGGGADPRWDRFPGTY